MGRMIANEIRFWVYLGTTDKTDKAPMFVSGLWWDSHPWAKPKNQIFFLHDFPGVMNSA